MVDNIMVRPVSLLANTSRHIRIPTSKTTLLNIVWVVKSRRMRWAGHVARVGEGCRRFWWGNLREKDHWGDPDLDGRIILRWIFRKWEGVVRTGWS